MNTANSDQLVLSKTFLPSAGWVQTKGSLTQNKSLLQKTSAVTVRNGLKKKKSSINHKGIQTQPQSTFKHKLATVALPKRVHCYGTDSGLGYGT